jgi:CTP:molybdopterin cytidylyltransferase MocA
MNRPTLVIMAAGMGSRYGGLKQLDPVTDEGEIIMDFSLYDAMMAGFDRAVFVIKEDSVKVIGLAVVGDFLSKCLAGRVCQMGHAGLFTSKD